MNELIAQVIVAAAVLYVNKPFYGRWTEEVEDRYAAASSFLDSLEGEDTELVSDELLEHVAGIREVAAVDERLLRSAM
jgi:hypothetical protein